MPSLGATIGITLGLLPSFAWLIFYLQEDLHPEPKRLVALVFIMGVVSAFFALFIQNSIVAANCAAANPLFLNCESLHFGNLSLTPVLIVIFALVEELVKFAAVYFTIKGNPAFNEPVDAMIYAIVAGLGFATIENVGVIIIGRAAEFTLVSELFEVASLRFVGATLLHSLASAIIGYYWAISMRDFGARRFLVWGIAVATLLHAAFNYLTLVFGNITFTLTLLIIAGFFVLNDFEKLKRVRV